MQRLSGKYALVQFSPVPERLEFLNIGVVLLVPEIQFVDVRFSVGQGRIDRAFGKQPKPFLDAVKESFANRLKVDLSRNMSEEFFGDFARKRANAVRLSPLQPVMIADPVHDLNRLFSELVGDDEVASREPRIRKRIADAFSRCGVSHLLDKPSSIELPEYGLEVNVPFAYQNGCYNLIDGMRLSSSSADSLREVGKRAMEGSLIWKHFQSDPSQKRLVVIGDFSAQSDKFYRAVKEEMDEAHVKLVRLDNIQPLVQDIRQHATLN